MVFLQSSLDAQPLKYLVVTKNIQYMPSLKRISKVNMNFIINKHLATTFDSFAKIVHNHFDDRAISDLHLEQN
jgi:hypothetical protein